MKHSLLLSLLLAWAVFGRPAAHAAEQAAGGEVPIDVVRLAAAAVASRDSQGLPFAVVDKRRARVFVYSSDGLLRADSPVLLGMARGDESVPGIGERPMADIRPGERTTPAGRVVSEPGINLQGEDIVWLDYDAAISMHRVRTSNRSERRLERLSSPDTDQRRISFGCINVPAAFYDTHLQPLFGRARGLIYILPETRAPEDDFAFLRSDGQRTRHPPVLSGIAQSRAP